MQLFAGFVVSLPFFVSAQDSNTSFAIYATDEEAAEQRKNFDIVLSERAASKAAGENSYCSNDMRSSFPGCTQSGTMWCWATAVAAAMEYYGVGGQLGDECHGIECQVVTWTYGDNCCPYIPGGHRDDACGQQGAYFQDIQKAMNHFTGMQWQKSTGPLDKSTLDAALQAGNPVILGIGGNFADHVVTLHGCGSDMYWYHDPERLYNEFIHVDYDWLLNQCVAWQHNGGHAILIPCQHGSPKGSDEIFRIEKKWFDTIYISGSTAVV